MSVVAEGDIRIDFSAALSVKKFDHSSTHGLSHCMAAVDYIVEEQNRLLFVEIKDPQDPAAQKERRDKFIEGMKSGILDNSLVRKYRDSFLYEWASDHINKNAHYSVLIALDTLKAPELLSRSRNLIRLLPVSGPAATPWKKPFAWGCTVHNLQSWNKYFPQFPASRISQIP